MVVAARWTQGPRGLMVEADLVDLNDMWHVYDVGRGPCYDMNDMLG